MSRHSRVRRRPGVVKAPDERTVEGKREMARRWAVNERANLRHQDNLDFYSLLRMAQERANRTGVGQSTGTTHGGQSASAHPFPQRYAGERV